MSQIREKMNELINSLNEDRLLMLYSYGSFLKESDIPELYMSGEEHAYHEFILENDERYSLNDIESALRIDQ